MRKMRDCVDTDVIASNKFTGPTNHVFEPTEIVHLSTSIDTVQAEDILPYLPDWFT